MANGVFSLLEVRAEQVKNIANENFASWSEGATYGYYAGGQPPATGISSIDRLDFFTEVLSSPGTPLGRSTNEFDGFSSSLYGYFGGGDTPTPSSDTRVDRLDFSTETITNPGNNLTPGRQALSATSSNSYGYFGGGNDGGSDINTITRLDFSNETVSNPGNNLPTGRSRLAATSSSSYGYFGGGENPAAPNPARGFSIISRLDFSNETASDPGKNLPTGRYNLAATSSSLYGYFGGGSTATAGAQQFDITITRLDFSNETASDTNGLPSARRNLAATSSSSYGYFGGGETSPTAINTISRLNFSTETASDPGNNLSIAKFSLAALSGGQSTLRGKGFKTYGYFGGGIDSTTPTIINTISRLDFSTETVSDPGNNLPTVRERLAATSSNSYGYFGGGGDGPAPSVICTISRLDFSNETVSNPGKNLPSARTFLSETSSNSYGYFGGGGIDSTGGSVINTISRLDFSNETLSNPGKNLPTARENLAATSSNSYGYFGGGATPTIINTISRLDFSTETVSDPGNNLPTVRERLAATSSNSYGYFGGGAGPTLINTISRLDFSTETVSNPGKNLPSARDQLAATSSNSYGYFGGGGTGAPLSSTKTISRLNFSTETVSDPGNDLPSARRRSGALSNSN